MRSIVIYSVAHKPDGAPLHYLSPRAAFRFYLPGKLMQVGEDSLRDIFYEIMIHIQGVDVGQSPDRVPRHLVKVVVTEVEIFQSGQEVIEGVRGYGVELVIGQDQVTKVGQAFEMVILVDEKNAP